MLLAQVVYFRLVMDLLLAHCVPSSTVAHALKFLPTFSLPRHTLPSSSAVPAPPDYSSWTYEFVRGSTRAGRYKTVSRADSCGLIVFFSSLLLSSRTAESAEGLETEGQRLVDQIVK